MKKLLLVFLVLTPHLTNPTPLCTLCKCPSSPSPNPTLDCSYLELTSLPSTPTWSISTNLTEETLNDFTVLDFSHNSLKTIDRLQQQEWHSVSEISFRHNSIESIAESAFIHLKALRRLDLSHNELTSDSIRADVFRGDFDNARYEPLSLVVLDLGYNKLHTLNARAFEHLPDLLELRVNNNPLKVIDVGTEMALATPPGLKILNLAYTGLSDVPDSFTHSMKSIQELYLNGNNFRKVPESLAALGDSLLKLNLNDNPMNYLDENSFLGLDNLLQLNISACQQLRAILPATFSGLIQLKSLHLSFNFNLTYIDVDAFRGLSDHWPIKEVYLNHNSLTTLPAKLLPWELIDTLDIQENPWRCDCALDWMTSQLLQRLEKIDPDRVIELRCHDPFELRGTQMLTLIASNNQVASFCSNDTVINRRRLPRNTTSSTIYIAVIGALTLAVIACALVVLATRRRWISGNVRFVELRDVRYSRE